MISQVARKSLLRLSASRFYSGGGTSISDFSTKKKGTGGGPFVELPQFKPLQDSLLIKIPSACTVYGKLDKISAITSDVGDDGKPFLAQDYDSTKELCMVTTGDSPANVLVASYTPMSNVVVIELDNYDSGLYVPNFSQEALCFSGDLLLGDSGQLKGRGVVALAGQGPVYQMNLKKNEQIIIACESLLAYDSNVQLRLTKLNSYFNVPKSVNEWLLRNVSSLYEKVLIQWTKFFNRDRIYCEVRGPGSVFLQSNFVPTCKSYSEAELLKVSQ